jgi:hypothetical protein
MRICRVASKPFMPGRLTSIRITPGCSSLAFCTASNPSDATEMILRSGSDSNISETKRCQGRKSSTTRICVTDMLKFFGTSRTETAAERSYRSFRSAPRAPKFCFGHGYMAQFDDDVGFFIFGMSDDCAPNSPHSLWFRCGNLPPALSQVDCYIFEGIAAVE